MKKSIQLISLLFTLFLIYCCENLTPYSDILENETDEVVSDGETTFNNFEELFNFIPMDTTIVDVSCEDLDSFRIGGLDLFFPPGNGSFSESEIYTFKLVEYYTRADMVKGKISNMTVQNKLVSSGCFYLEIRDSSNNQIHIGPNFGVVAKLLNQTDNSGYENDMLGQSGYGNQFFSGTQILWNNNNSILVEFDQVNDKFIMENILDGYNQCSANLISTTEQANVKIKVNNTEPFINNKVYFISNDYTMVIELNQYHLEDNYYYSNLNFPMGIEGEILVISLNENILNYYLGDYNVSDNIEALDITPITLSELEQLLNDLQ